MTKTLTVQENLKRARAKAHQTMIKNGHFKRMAQASLKARKVKGKKKKGVDKVV